MAKQEHQERDPGDLAGGIGVGVLMLLVSSFLTWCFVSGVQEGEAIEPFGQIGTLLLGVLLLTAVWSMTVRLFVSCSSRQAMQKVSGILGKIAELGLVCFLLAVGFKGVVAPANGDEQVAGGGATFLALLLGYCFVGVLAFRDVRRSRSGGKSANLSPYEVGLMWPVLFFTRAPLLALIVFSVVGGLTYLGERIGANWGFAFLGAIGGAAVVPVLLLGIGMVSAWADRREESGGGRGE